MSNIKVNRRKYVPVLVIILCILISVIVFIVLSLKGVKNLRDNVVAIRLTSDGFDHGPIEFNGDVYFPSSYNFPDNRNSEVLGELVSKNAGSFSLWLFNSEVIADKTDDNYTHLKTQGDDATRYTKAEYLEEPSRVKENLEKYSKFVIVDDSSYKDIRITINKEIILELENKFSSVKYYSKDFDNYDKLYYIFVDSPSAYVESVDGKEILEVHDDPIVYIGCIFVADKQLFYGNMNNRIEGDLANKLYRVIESESIDEK